MYDTVEEVRQKLEGSVVLYDGHPIRITGSGGRKGTLTVGFVPLPGGTLDKDICKLDDPKFDCWSVGSRLGYVNYAHREYKQAVYTMRMPVRNTHGTQGLNSRNVAIDKLKPYRRKHLGGGQLSFYDNLCQTDGFTKTLKRLYPNFTRCAKVLEEDDLIYSVAFNPAYAIRRSQYPDTFLLDYKGTEIGISDDLDKFRIQPEFKYLKNSLVECGLKVA